MKSITLRTLVREPLKVKRMTGAGQPVEITDKGQPLWILQPATDTRADETRRRAAIDEILDEVLREKPASLCAARILEESRR